MAAALQDVKGGMSVREAARLNNLPYETLRRRVVEKVDLEYKSGPPTVLTEHEEDELASYCVKMADMGFGLSRSDVMVVAFKIAESSLIILANWQQCVQIECFDEADEHF